MENRENRNDGGRWTLKRKRGIAIAAAVIGIAVGAILGNTIWTVKSPHAAVHRAAQSSVRWHGLLEVNTSFMRDLYHFKVETAQGKSITLAEVKKPILFSAPFCPWCAKTEKLLITNHLLGKFQIVGVDLDGGAKDLPFLPISVTTVQAAKAVFARDWHYYGIKWPVLGLDFAMPGSPIDQAVQQFPMALIPHDGHWYVQLGYHSSPQFWKSILS